MVAPTSADARDTMVNGPSGIVAISPPWDRPTYEPSKRSLTWKNGAKALLFSAEEPERLRGPQFDTAWCDELGAWKYQRETWDQLQFGLRLGRVPDGGVELGGRGEGDLADHAAVHRLEDVGAAPRSAGDVLAADEVSDLTHGRPPYQLVVC